MKNTISRTQDNPCAEGPFPCPSQIDTGRSGSILIFLIGLLWFQPALSTGAASAEKDAEILCVVSYNLRFASPDPPNAWYQRRDVMRESIEMYAPDIIGTQEGLIQQLLDMEEDLPQYDWIGVGRDGGNRGEFMAIFYLKERFEPLVYDHYWLSDTPEVIASATWGNTNRRMVTWVKFHDRVTDHRFYVVNTHLDHASQTAREKAARLIVERIGEFDPDLPVLLMGDFNAVAHKNVLYDMLVTDTDFVDTWDASPIRRGEGINTFHGFRGPQEGGRRIDWILARGPVTVHEAEISTFHRDGQYPSDHFPVISWIKIQNEKD